MCAIWKRKENEKEVREEGGRRDVNKKIHFKIVKNGREKLQGGA